MRTSYIQSFILYGCQGLILKLAGAFRQHQAADILQFLLISCR